MKEYREALEKLKKSPEDRLAIVGKYGIVGMGITAGVAASSSVAATAGATTLLGSTTLANLLGGVLVTTTPVGWVIGTAAASGVIAYGMLKFFENGIENNEKKLQNIKELEKKISELEKESNQSMDLNKKYAQVADMYISLIDYDMITEEEIEEVLKMIGNGTLDINLAFTIAKENLSNVKEAFND